MFASEKRFARDSTARAQPEREAALHSGLDQSYLPHLRTVDRLGSLRYSLLTICDSSDHIVLKFLGVIVLRQLSIVDGLDVPRCELMVKW